MGDSADDEDLRTEVSCARRVVRKTDVIGRPGGDGFSASLPETKPTNRPEPEAHADPSRRCQMKVSESQLLLPRRRDAVVDLPWPAAKVMEEYSCS
jgi:GGDEF domain-containing protein